ncbi:MAG: IclR family transcriptional regulator [Deltaproteobacteria bacterium]|nr:MAG: IclR family transcriptional regulator [Deltaproteobacteria bacterium]
MNTLIKAFRILEEVILHQERGLAFSEIVSNTGLPKASTHRILKALVEIAYLRYDPETGKYRGDLKLSCLGAEVTAHFDVKSYVRPHLMNLHEETGHTCHLGIRNGNVGIYLDKLESRDYGIKLFSEVGKSFPLHCTGLGKILLAFMNPNERDPILKGHLEHFTTNTITDVTVLNTELEQIRKQGYAVDREEITRGIMCVAAPVFYNEGGIVAAISLTFPSFINEERGIEREIEAVKRCPENISGMFRGAESSG